MANDIPLREKKYAKTKLAIMEEFMRELQQNRFNDISIQKVCAAVEISEGTFYNYFPRKFDVLVYSLQIINTHRIWQIDQQSKDTCILTKIDLFFELITKEFTEPHVLYEMMTAMISERFEKMQHDISAVERTYAYPECPGIEGIQACCPEEYFTAVLISAKDADELPSSTNIEDTVILLMSILCGVMLAIPTETFDKALFYMQKQLSFLWKGIGRTNYENE